MGKRLITAAATLAAAGVLQLIATTGAAHAARTCTWGGTPAAPTGQSRNDPGVSNSPSPTALRFRATGPLGGDCRGRLTFVGQMDRGATCGLISFHGRAYGLRGVWSFAGVSAGGVAPARLYDRRGRIVGSETAQFLTNAPFSACNTKTGLRKNNFSSVITL